MPLKAIILLPILYFLTLIQSSFLPHFSFFGHSPNIIFSLIVFLIFFAPSFALIAAFLGGVFLDIFSSNFLGFNVLMLPGIIFFFKLVLKRYVKVPFG